MKYWNKDRDIRRKYWTKVEVMIDGWEKPEAKRWCQLQESPGRFYYYYGSNSWWFENEEDTTLFLLRWA